MMVTTQQATVADLSGLTDESLAREAQAGHPACFCELVSRYERRLLRFLLGKVGNRADAEDLLQEAFARAYQRIDSYDDRWRFSTWLYTIATRLAYSHHRKRRSEPLEQTQWIEANAAGPADTAQAADEGRTLWAIARETLSENQFTALWLRYVEALSVKETARAMSKSETNVKVLLHRARTTLAGELAQTQAWSEQAQSASRVATAAKEGA